MFESIINKTGKTLLERLDAVSYNVGYYDILSLNLPNWATSFIQSQADLSIYADLLYMQSKQYYLLSAEDTEEFKDLLRSRMLFTKEYLVENCQKSVKFAINSLLRPRNILKFFVFSNKLQVSKSEILHFLSFFSHYSYLIDKLKIKIISDNRNFITVHQFSDMIAAIDDAYIQSLNIDGFMSIMGELFDFFGEDGLLPAEAAIMFFDDKKLNHIATSIFSDFLTQNKAKLNRDDLSELLKRLFVRADVIEFDENELKIYNASSEDVSDKISAPQTSFDNEPISEEFTANNEVSDFSLDSDLSTEDFIESEESADNPLPQTATDLDLSEFDFSSDKIAAIEEIDDYSLPETATELDLSEFDLSLSAVSDNITADDHSQDDDATLIIPETNQTVIEDVSLDETGLESFAYESIIVENDLTLAATLDTDEDEKFSLFNAHVQAENDIINALSDFLPANETDDANDFTPEGLSSSITIPNLTDNTDIESALSQFITEFNEINKDQLSNTDNPIHEKLSQSEESDAQFSNNNFSSQGALENYQAQPQTDIELTNFSAIEDEIEDLSSEIAAFSQSDSSEDESINISSNVGDINKSSEDAVMTDILEDIYLGEFNSELIAMEPADPTQSAIFPNGTVINSNTYESKETISNESSLEEQIIDIGDVILAAKDSFNNNEIGENFTDMDEDIFLLELKQHYNEESDEIC